jgi:hypothetical protein
MKHHTFNVICAFSMQYTVDESEIGTDGEPTENAVIALEKELEEYLQQNYAVNVVDVEVDMLLGVDDDADG